MGGQLVEPRLGQRVAALAGRQHGVVGHSELIELGVSDDMIAGWLRAGRMVSLHRGVYAVGHAHLSSRGRFLAAVLACGPGAALSHQSAAVLWGLREPRGPRIDVTVPTPGGRARRRLVVVHRSIVRPDEIEMRDGIRVTTAARTVLDLAGALTRRQLERTLDQAAFLGVDLTYLAPRRGKRGAALLRTVLTQHDAGSTWTRSRLEERMLGLCTSAGLPRPLVNREVVGFEVDFHWPEQLLVVEIDDWSSHRGRGAFERDRLRDAVLVEAGWRVVRITRARLARDPTGVAAQLGRLLYPDGSSSNLPVVRRP
jgi:predicted transcriptional regulator of viral defense system